LFFLLPPLLAERNRRLVDLQFSKIDEMWYKWLVPGIIPLQKEIEADTPPYKGAGFSLARTFSGKECQARREDQF
jgi:hypothetical protein